jgi:predicted acyl esterase
MAERGFQVILQSVRGTFGSGGVFEPMRNEREDGLATLEWVVKQPWFGDSIVLVGPSYLGYVQWAVAHRFKAGHRIRVQVSSGSVPRYARNPGTGESRATASRLAAADQSVYHDPAHPSATTLPTRQAGSGE